MTRQGQYNPQRLVRRRRLHLHNSILIRRRDVTSLSVATCLQSSRIVRIAQLIPSQFTSLPTPAVERAVDRVISCNICDFVMGLCMCVRALKDKRLELLSYRYQTW